MSRAVGFIGVLLLVTAFLLWNDGADDKRAGVLKVARAADPLQRANGAGGDRSPVTRQALKSPRGVLEVEVVSHGLGLPAGQAVLVLTANGWRRQYRLAGQTVQILLPEHVKPPLALHCENRRGRTLSGRLDVRELPPRVRLKFHRRIPVPLRFETADRAALKGLLYANVHRSGPAKRARAADPVPIKNYTSQGAVQVLLDVDHARGRLCGYVRGYAPAFAELLGRPGFPWNLDTIVLRFRRGVVVRGRVLDASGNPVAGQGVLIRSCDASDLGGETMYLSFGTKHSRVSGGVSETAKTDERGHFSFAGVPEAVAFRLSVLGSRVQTRPDPSTVLRATSNPLIADLYVR